MVYCAKSKTAKKRTWCKKTPCAVDSDNKSCILDGKTNRCRARISKKALPKKKSSKIIKKTKKTEEVAEELPAPPLRRSARLNTAKGVATPPKPKSKKASRAKVFNNKDLVTPGGLSTKDLVKSNGRIVSKVKSKIGKKNSWALAVKKARKELKIDGFAVIKKGEPIYDLAMKYYKGSVGGAEGAKAAKEIEKEIFEAITPEEAAERRGSKCVVRIDPEGPSVEGVAADNAKFEGVAADNAEFEAAVTAVEDEVVPSINAATDLDQLKVVVTDILRRVEGAGLADEKKKTALMERAMEKVSPKRKTLLAAAMAEVASEADLTQVLEDASKVRATDEDLIEAYKSLMKKEPLEQAVKRRAEKALAYLEQTGRG